MEYLNFNNASTTVPCKEVIDDFVWCASNIYGNPSDVTSSKGLEAKNIITNAQEEIVKYINVDYPSEIIFTSGGSESNNLAIKGYLDRYPCINTIITTKLEHPSVYNTCMYLSERKNYRVLFVDVEKSTGVISLKNLETLLKENEDTSLVSIMMSNNEIGTINDIRAISKLVHKYGCILHVDAVQAFGHMNIDVKYMGIDMMSVSFHKFGGFKNSGFLYLTDTLKLSPIIHGGNQFNGVRPGTENVPVIYALGNHVKRISQREFMNSDMILYLYNNIEETANKLGITIKLNGCKIDDDDYCKRINNNLSITFDGINAEQLITLMDMRHINISAGSACCSGDKKPSRVLKEIGLTDEEAFSTVRISINEDTTTEECNIFLKCLEECLTIINTYK